ncbi:acyl-ACP desaturase [Blastococcus sp. TML/M2B]|uniref:acyl-ACP desaturase n=1 Tax=Blastococcus sp. TML/M2B TaxID=2798727 RepID=UPI001F5BE8AC|nr:acyl-ACP desaturase [Blastococcus sp. TML/M2B]
MPQTSPQAAVLTELEPVVAENLDRHIRMAKEWHPHDYVPWDEGRNFAFLGGEEWSPEQSRLDQTAKAAMFVNLLTEDNLPSYHREIATRFGRDGAWGQWVGRWTAEEGRHGVALRDYLVVTRGVDPVELERARMDYMTTGYDSGDKSPLEAVAYVSFQELATRVSHRNTGKATGDPIADKLLARIATDENLHMIFYRNLVTAAFDIDPDETMKAVATEVMNFEMPGANMANFRKNSTIIAKAGIYEPAPAPRRGRRADPAHLEGLRAQRPRPRGRAGPRAARRVHGRSGRPGGQVRGEPRADARPHGRQGRGARPGVRSGGYDIVGLRPTPRPRAVPPLS